MPCILPGNPTRTLDISPEMQGSKSLLTDRQFFRVGEAPARAAIMLHLRIGYIWVYQMQIGKGNPTKVHLNEEPKSTLRKNTFSGMRTKVQESEAPTEEGVILSIADLWPSDYLPYCHLRTMTRIF